MEFFILHFNERVLLDFDTELRNLGGIIPLVATKKLSFSLFLSYFSPFFPHITVL